MKFVSFGPFLFLLGIYQAAATLSPDCVSVGTATGAIKVKSDEVLTYITADSGFQTIFRMIHADDRIYTAQDLTNGQQIVSYDTDMDDPQTHWSASTGSDVQGLALADDGTILVLHRTLGVTRLSGGTITTQLISASFFSETLQDFVWHDGRYWALIAAEGSSSAQLRIVDSSGGNQVLLDLTVQPDATRLVFDSNDHLWVLGSSSTGPYLTEYSYSGTGASTTVTRIGLRYNSENMVGTARTGMSTLAADLKIINDLLYVFGGTSVYILDPATSTTAISATWDAVVSVSSGAFNSDCTWEGVPPDNAPPPAPGPVPPSPAPAPAPAPAPGGAGAPPAPPGASNSPPPASPDGAGPPPPPDSPGAAPPASPPSPDAVGSPPSPPNSGGGTCPDFKGRECADVGTCSSGSCVCQTCYKGNDCSTCDTECTESKGVVCVGWVETEGSADTLLLRFAFLALLF